MPKRSSASRTLCKICNVWIADNKIQKRQHEEAAKHKQAKVALLKEIAEKNERKAKEERKAAALALGGTGAGPPTGNSAAVAQQLLETAAGAGANRNTKTTHCPSKRPLEIDAQENPGDNITGDSAAGELPAREALDENGFPLPATAVYGQWQPVANDDAEQAQDSEQMYWGQRPVDSGGADEAGKESGDVTENKEKETRDNDIREARGHGNDAAGDEVEVTFKRRAAPRTRRVRRKTSGR